MAAKDWTKIYQDPKYKGRWVALKDDEETIAASGKTAREAIEQAKQLGHPNAILMFVPVKPEVYRVFSPQLK
jgi:Family of unknown function (DUF5678)